ncbi:MAG TPA: hypothetical protein VE967_13120 [Gemmatimonadaceae bacterium]|nr:hypothetical protein [Gemmatimonadaceae bacterium]
MTKMQAISDPVQHARDIRAMLMDVVQHARAVIPEVDEPRACALFETTAEVVLGLTKAFEDFEQGREAAWRRT